jgi:succinyl-CoA synthetase alpha subunit
MAILVGSGTKAIVQNITGSQGTFHTKLMLGYGTKIVGGVTPGKGGRQVEGVPVFDTVNEAVSKTGANASIIFVDSLLRLPSALLEVFPIPSIVKGIKHTNLP